MQVNKLKLVILVGWIGALFTPSLSMVNGLEVEKNAWAQLTNIISRKELRNNLAVDESINFDHFMRCASYQEFARVISNNWQSVLTSFSAVGTNETERIALVGVGKSFGEDFYIAYGITLANLYQEHIVTSNELEWYIASRLISLDTCLIRRYQEPQVTNFVSKLKVAFPARSTWDRILSGVAYTNYLEEVEAGLWD